MVWPTLYSILFILSGMSFGTARGTQMYPFGSRSSDLSLERQDDAFTTIPLLFDFPFFGKVFREIHVSTNGIIYFGRGNTSYMPAPFPLNDTKSVAAYWLDSDPREGGDIFYREVFDPDVLSKISDEVRSKFINYPNFRSSWAFIVTFNNVPRFGCGSNSSFSCQNIVNHQTIITSNGIDSFVIFLYDRLEYANAQIGFNAGDGKRYFLMPYSNTPDISSHALKESNVGEPGKWMFFVSNEISSACDASGLSEVYPKKVLYYGSQEITIVGPCLKPCDSSIDVTIGDSNVTCSIVNGLKIICRTPYMDVIGRVDIHLTYNNVSYKTFVISHDVNDEVVTSKNLEVSGDDIDTPFNITWNVSSNTNYRPTICGMQEDIVLDKFGNIVTMERIQIYIRPPNTGEYEYLPKHFSNKTEGHKDKRNTIRKIYLVVGRFVLEKIYFEAGVEFSCQHWFKSQPSNEEISKLKEKSSRRNPCQPTVPSNFPIRLSGNFEVDETCNPSGNSWCAMYRPGAKGCYRSTNNPNNFATQCCYNNNNQLLLGPTGGGSLSLNDPKKSKLKFFTNEIVPYTYCFKLQHKYDQYYEKRPSIDSRYFVPPVVRGANGDPHFKTIDGTEYDFNPVGEFIYLRGSGMMVQTRIAQYVDKDGNAKQASYFSAFAIKSIDSDVVQIDMTAVKTLQVKLGKTVLTEGSMNLKDLFINFVNSSYVIVDFNEGLMIRVFVLNGMLQSIIELDESFKRRVSGLIGNWDNDTENDFMLPNGTFIPKNSSNRDIHHKFGMEWTTNENTSIFSYPVGLSWKDYQNSTFIPVFDAPPSDPRCRGNKNCLFDLHVTGDIDVALSNNVVEENVKNIEMMLKDSSETCILNLNITHGRVDVTYNSSDTKNVNYTITCQPEYILIGSNKSITCTKGKLSNEFPAKCYSKNLSNTLVANCNRLLIIASAVLLIFISTAYD